MGLENASNQEMDQVQSNDAFISADVSNIEESVAADSSVVESTVVDNSTALESSVAESSVVDSSELISTTGDVSETELGASDALAISGLGFAIVFVVLIVLMAFIGAMSFLLKGTDGKKKENTQKPVQAPVQKPVKKETAPVSAPAATSAPEGSMFVTLGGKKHTVTVVEKVPRFTVKVNGKSHAVDVEPIEEDAE